MCTATQQSLWLSPPSSSSMHMFTHVCDLQRRDFKMHLYVYIYKSLIQCSCSPVLFLVLCECVSASARVGVCVYVLHVCMCVHECTTAYEVRSYCTLTRCHQRAARHPLCGIRRKTIAHASECTTHKQSCTKISDFAANDGGDRDGGGGDDDVLSCTPHANKIKAAAQSSCMCVCVLVCA